MVVHGEGDAAAHVTDDQILLLILHTVLATVPLGYLALVQGVPDGLVGQFGQTGDARHVVEFVHDSRIDGEGSAALDLTGDAQRYQRTQVTGMVQPRVACVLNHLVVQFVHTAFDGLHQTATTHYHVEVHRVALTLNLLHDLLPAIVKLVHDERIATQLLKRMVQCGVHQQLLVLEDSHFRRDHSRINSQYFHRSNRFKFLCCKVTKS